MTMHCHDAELLLTGFAAGELDAADADLVAAHLAACADCRAEMDRELLLRGLLAGLPQVAAPAGLGDVDVDAAVRRPRPWLPALGGLVAAAVALAVLLPTGRTPAPPADPAAIYTAAEVAAARRDVIFSLALTARIIERTERHTVADVFGRRLPQAVSGSLGGGTVTPEGGRG